MSFCELMQIQFTKMHGLGNDFMVIDGLRQKITLTPTIISQLANRHLGIGFDQLLLVEASITPGVDFYYRIFNADGSEVSQCGNGARCLARFVLDQGLTSQKHIIVETHAGRLELISKDKGEFSVNMGIPLWLPEQIPCLANEESLIYSIKISSGLYNFSTLNLGNPHCVLQVDSVKTAAVAEIGALLTSHPHFPEGVNVGFMQILDRQNISLRVYERGAGETLACGSGACAAAVIGQRLGLLDSAVTVHLLGGNLQIAWEGGENNPVWMTGPAVTVFNGVIDI
ncbi:diaminopimelate epimerase [soil metagenome]